MTSSSQVWLITGCSSGLGQQFAIDLLAAGEKVIATARILSSLTYLSSLGASTLQLDLTSPQSSINTTIKQAISIHGHIDVLINNASYIQIGTLEDLTTEDLQAQFNTNVFGTFAVTRALLPHFRERRAGTVVFLSSLSGHVGHAGCGAYAGSKFAIEGMAESFAAETAGFGIRTLVIAPGRFRTKLLSTGNMRGSRGEGAYKELLEGLEGHLRDQDGRQHGDPRKLVRTVIHAVKGQGMFDGREVPLRLPLGRDSVAEMEVKYSGILRTMMEWKGVVDGTDFEE